VPTLRVEQIKNTKTILRVFIHGIGGVYRSLSTAKNAEKQLSTRFFAAPASTNAKRRKLKREKKILNEYLPEEIILFIIPTFNNKYRI